MFMFSMLSRSSYPGPPLYLPLIRDSRKGESLRLSVEQIYSDSWLIKLHNILFILLVSDTIS